MTTITTTPTTNTTDTIACDPHHLGDAGEPLAYEAELRARFRVSGNWLRQARRRRRVRYVDLRPDSPPGKEAAERYLYALVDVARERTRVEAPRAAVASAAPLPPAAPAPPAPPPPSLPRPPPPPPLVPRPAAHAKAKVHGKVPEVVYTRRAGGTRP